MVRSFVTDPTLRHVEGRLNAIRYSGALAFPSFAARKKPRKKHSIAQIIHTYVALVLLIHLHQDVGWCDQRVVRVPRAPVCSVCFE